MSDINLLAPIVTLAVGIALGYGFRGLIAREEARAYAILEAEYLKLVAAIGERAKKVKEAL